MPRPCPICANVLVLGPTGVGKTYIACALGHQACRDGYHVLYQRLPRLLADLEIAHADGRYPKLLQRLAKIDVLVLDGWGLETLTDRSRHDLLDILDDRYQTGSTLVTSQLPVTRTGKPSSDGAACPLGVWVRNPVRSR